MSTNQSTRACLLFYYKYFFPHFLIFIILLFSYSYEIYKISNACSPKIR